MANPAMLFTVPILALVSTVAASGNATASPSTGGGNATAGLTKNTRRRRSARTMPWATAPGDWKANASAANYSAWAANRTIYLGDYLSEFKFDRARS